MESFIFSASGICTCC